jgi:ketosteroid isomerase-like protein
MAEEDVEIVRRLLLAYSRGDFPTMLDLIHAEIRVHPRPEEPGVEDVTRDATGSSPTQATG